MKVRVAILAAGLVATAATFWGCEWSGGSDNGFNTSRAGLDVNVSGVYFGTLSGGKAVDQTSGATISRFNIFQNGNALEVIDSNGQKYRGTAGAPGAVIDLQSAAASGSIPAGVLLASYQIFFSGTDGVAAREIEFSGIIDVVTVSDVQGDSTEQTFSNSQGTERTTESTTESDSSSGSTSENSSDNSASSEIGSEFETEPGGGEIITPGPGDGDFDSGAFDVTTSGSESFEQNSSSSTGDQSDRNQSTTSSSSTSTTAAQEQETSRTISTTFELTEANSQFRLRGTWIETDGLVSAVEARSTGSGLLSAENLPDPGDGNTGGGGGGGGGGTTGGSSGSSGSSGGSSRSN